MRPCSDRPALDAGRRAGSRPRRRPNAPQIPPELSDPAMADKLGRMAGVADQGADGHAGRRDGGGDRRAARRPQPTRHKRVRDEIGGPEAERQVEAEVAASGRQMQAMTKALVASLPAIMGALDGVEKELERAAANMPDPTYPSGQRAAKFIVALIAR